MATNDLIQPPPVFNSDGTITPVIDAQTYYQRQEQSAQTPAPLSAMALRGTVASMGAMTKVKASDITGDILGAPVNENVGVDFKTYWNYYSLPEGDREPFQQMTFTLADEQATVIKNAISDMQKTDEFKYAETFGNENSNGNALYLIVAAWAGQRI